MIMTSDWGRALKAADEAGAERAKPAGVVPRTRRRHPGTSVFLRRRRLFDPLPLRIINTQGSDALEKQAVRGPPGDLSRPRHITDHLSNHCRHSRGRPVKPKLDKRAVLGYTTHR